MLPSRRLRVAHSRLSRVKISCIGHVQHLNLHDDGIHDGGNTCKSDSSLLPITSSNYVYSGINRTYSTVFPRNNVCLQVTDERRLKSAQLFHTTTYTSNDVNSNATNTSAAPTAVNNTLTERIVDHIPESITSITSSATIWGATAFLLTNFHTHLHIPYWACISLTNVCIRSGMLPIAIRGAKTSVKFGNIAPEVQYLISSFTRDFQKLKASSPEGGGGVVRMGDRVGFVDTTKEQLRLVKTTVSTLQGVMKLAKVNLFDIFKSPMLQIPFFWYFALDLRKVINGVDPQLAQQLVDSSFLWITDLTEPDPWYGLPILTGALLYLNVEVAVGKRALSGETSSRSNLQSFLKDAFQSLAIFMPCFMVQQPSGVQIYLATSMVFTMAQSVAFRNDTCRAVLGLPPVGAKPTGEHLKEFTELVEQRMKAKEETGFYLGEGILLLDRGFAQLGEKRVSSIDITQDTSSATQETQSLGVIELPQYTIDSMLVYPEKVLEWSAQRSSTAIRPTPLLPPAEMSSQSAMHSSTPMSEAQQQELMDAANRGEKPKNIEMAPKEVLQRMEDQKQKNTAATVDVKKFGSKSRKRGKKRPRR
jgi:membrane protein insertase Oxa1/YidC/SpoIIIJ